MRILNCITNSFFRTIGRVLAYLAIGALLVALFSKAHLPSFEEIINDSLFMKVDAAVNDRLFVQNVTINNETTYVPSVGWYIAYTQFYIPMQPTNQDLGYFYNVVYRFDNINIPVNTKTLTIGLYVHNSDSLEQDYLYNAYSEGYQIYQSNKNLYSMSLYYDGNDGFNYCNPAGNNGEFFYFTCPVITNSLNQLNLTIHANKTSYNFNSWFTFGIRSAFTLDVEGNNISDLISAETSNTNAIIANQNSNNQAVISNQNSNTQQIINNQQSNTNATIENQNQNANMINSTLTDQSGPDNLATISNDAIVGYLPPGPVDSLITLPLVILNGINNSLSTTCSAISLPLPFVNENIELPCMQSLYYKMGVLSYINWAGIIASAFLLYSYLIRFYKWVDNVLTLRENNYLDNWGGAE